MGKVGTVEALVGSRILVAYFSSKCSGNSGTFSRGIKRQNGTVRAPISLDVLKAPTLVHKAKAGPRKASEKILYGSVTTSRDPSTCLPDQGWGTPKVLILSPHYQGDPGEDSTPQVLTPKLTEVKGMSEPRDTHRT